MLMDLLSRRRALMGGGDHYVDPFPNHVRMIVRGNGDSEQFVGTITDVTTKERYIDGVQVATNSDMYIFGDTNLHDVHHNGNIPQQGSTCNNNNIIVIDYPANRAKPKIMNQSFKRDGNAHLDIIIRHPTFIGALGTGPWVTSGWTKSKISLYVPMSTVEDYAADGGWGKATVLPIEGSKYEKRKAIKDLKLE